MLNIFIYTSNKFEKKAQVATKGLKLETTEDTDVLSLFKKIREMITSNEENNYLMDDVSLLELLHTLESGFNNITIYLSSRLLFGSKWSKFTKQDKEDFNKAVNYAIKFINDKKLKGKMKGV